MAIINHSMARYFFGDESPIGRLIAPWGGNSDPTDCEIIGVVEDAAHFDLKEPPKRVLYVPYEQGPDFLQGENMILEVRSASAPAVVAAQVRELVAQMDKNVLVESETLETHVNRFNRARAPAGAVVRVSRDAVAAPGGNWTVWSDGLLGDASNWRDRHPSGPWRTACNCFVDGAAGKFCARPGWRCHRCPCRPRVEPSGCHSALWRQLSGCGCVCRCRRRHGCCCSAGDNSAGATCGKGRSDGCVAVRIARSSSF